MKKVLSLLFVCVLVVSALVLTGCKTDELQTQINDNATKAESDLAEVKASVEKEDDALDAKITAEIDKVTANLATAKTDLEKLISDGAKADAAALKAAVETLNAAIDAAESAAVEADAELKTILEAAIAEAEEAAVTAAKGYVDAKVEDLNVQLEALEEGKATKTDVASAIEEVNRAIDLAEEVAADANDTLKTTLEAAIADADAAAKGAWDDWNAATDKVIENLYELKLAYNKFVAKEYYPMLTEDAQNKVLEVYTTTEIELFRAIDITSAEKAWTDAKVVFETIDGIFEEMGKYDMIHYYADEQAEIAELYDDAIEAVEAITRETTAEEVAAIETTLAKKLADVLTKAKVIDNLLTSKGADVTMDVIYDAEWEELLADVKTMLDAESDELKTECDELAAVVDKYDDYKARYDYLGEKKVAAGTINDRVTALTALLDRAPANDAEMAIYGYNATNIAEYNAIIDAIDAWDEDLLEDGDTNDTNKSMIDRDAVETMDESFATVTDAHDEYVADLVARLEAFGADYVYNYDVAVYDEINDLYSESLYFAACLELFQGLEDPAEFVDAFGIFEDGAYARANALAAAKDEADEINARVDQLIAELTNITTFKSEYQIRMEEIDADVAAWIATYFTDTEYAAEATEEGNVNYALLDHADYASLDDLYEQKIVPILEAMDDVVEKFNAEGFVTINTLSGDDIAIARESWQNFVVLVNDLGLDIEDIGEVEGITGNATPAKIAQLLDNKTIEYRAACAQAVADYEALNILNKDTVNIYDKADVDAMVAWYDTYLGIDATDAESTVPADGIDLALSEDLVITEALYDAAKATYTAWKTMTDAKIAEEEALEAGIEALIAGTVNTETRAAIDALIDRYEAFMNGANYPDGYSADQYKIDPADLTYVIDNYDDLVNADAVIATLEDRLYADDGLFARVDALTKTVDDLLTQTAVDEYKALIAELEADIATFTADNSGFNCFVESEGTTYTNREFTITTAKFTIAQGVAVQELRAGDTATRGALNANGRTQNIVYAGSKDLLAAAEAEIRALEVAEVDAVTYTTDEITAIVDLTNAKYEALIDLETAYETYISVQGGTDNANEKVWDSAQAVLKVAVDDVNALADIAAVEARADEAEADLAAIRDMADIYDNAILNVELIETDAVKANLTERADAALAAAIATIVEIGNEGIATDESYALDNARLALVEWTITEYVRIRDIDDADAKTEAAMAERYENTVKGTSIAQMSDEKVAEYKAANKTIADLLVDAKASVTNFFEAVGESI